MKNSICFFIVLLFASFYLKDINAQCFSTQTFNNAGDFTYTVPGVPATSLLIEIEAVGADGGKFLWGSNPSTDGGQGASMKASFLVNGGDNLLIMVGEKGSDAIGSPGGGGGAGGTAVVINNTDVLIAAGAGGGGGQGGSNLGGGGQANTDSPAQGGAGPGTSGGGGFNEDGEDGVGGTGGGAGTLTGSGLGGIQGVVAGPGGDGFGGGGGGSGTVGGGGGGYKGGDGSPGSGGDLYGRGGDSFVNTGYSSTLIFNTAGADGGGNGLDGSVIITCIPLDGVEIQFVSQTDPSCFGSSDGQIVVSASGGLSPYTFTLDGGSSNNTGVFDDLSAGTYTVTVSDGGGSSASIQVTLGQPDQLILTVIQTENNACEGDINGSIEVEASGGTGGYTYVINGVTQTSGSFNSLPNGTYLILAFDENNCSAEVSVEITSESMISLSINSITNVSCFSADDGSVIIFSSGGNNFTFSLDGGDYQDSNQFSGIAAGDHVVTALDDLGCSAQISFTIVEPDELILLIEDTQDVSCFGSTDGSIEVSAMGGTGTYTYSINDGAFTNENIFISLSAGTNNVNVMDNNGCISSSMVEILSPDSLELTLTSQTDINCGEAMTGAIELNLDNSGDVMYMLGEETNTNGVFSGLDAGDYVATATTANGCMTSMTITIGQSSSITVSIDNVQNLTCDGSLDGAITVSASNGAEPYTYSIDDGDFVASGDFMDLDGSLYSITVMDSEGCITLVEVEVIEPEPLLIEIDSKTDADCSQGTLGTINLSATGGTSDYTFNIGGATNNDGQFSEITQGSYMATALDNNGCIVSTSFDIALVGNLVIDSYIATDVSCFGEEDGSISDISILGGNGNYCYTLNGGDIDSTGHFTDLGPGSYSLVAFDDIGCSDTTDVFISEPAPLTLEIVDFINDNGTGNGSITVAANGGTKPYDYSINENMTQTDSVFTSLSNNEFTITVTDANGCTTTIIHALTSITETVNSLSLYPNPTSNMLTIVPENYMYSEYNIYNTKGQLLESQSILKAKNRLDIDVSRLPSGLLIIELVGEDVISRASFIKI